MTGLSKRLRPGSPRLPVRSFFAAALVAGGISSAAVPTPAPAAVLATMEKVADWQLAHPSRHDPHDWTQGAGYTGMMALARLSPSPRFYGAMMKMGNANQWKPGPRPYLADDICVVQTYAELYLLRRDPAMIAPARAQFDQVIAHPPDNDLSFDPQKDPDRLAKWSWCDSLFMGPPAWIRLYAATGDRAYLDYMVRHWWQTSDYLYDPAEHLFFRDSGYFAKREANGRKVFWSRGNGWVMAGLVRVLEFLPKDHPARARFVRQFQEMADRILACQQADGLWRASLLDPDSFPLQETSGSGFYCYALAWGVNEGLLDRTKFAPKVWQAWNALASCVQADGKLTHVQPIGADPRHFDENSTEVYGVGALLLAGSEIIRLAPAP
jgi:unsaturated rhamnogalacturonyl hydrolase